MAGAVDVETRGAMEVGERDGGFRCELIQQGVKAKKAAGEGVLRGLEAGGKVSSPVGWRYIRQALNALLS